MGKGIWNCEANTLTRGFGGRDAWDSYEVVEVMCKTRDCVDLDPSNASFKETNTNNNAWKKETWAPRERYSSVDLC